MDRIPPSRKLRQEAEALFQGWEMKGHPLDSFVRLGARYMLQAVLEQEVEERLWKLHKMRPRLPRPRGLVAIPWPRYARSLQELGVWERIAARVISPSFPGVERDCEYALSQLRQAESRELRKAIIGEGYHSLWEGPRQGAAGKQ